MALSQTDNPPESNVPIHAPDSIEWGDWAVLLTLSRQEKEAARLLSEPCPQTELPFGYYLPYIRSRTPGTSNKVYVPMFPCTLFAVAPTCKRVRNKGNKRGRLEAVTPISPEEGLSVLKDFCQASKCIYKMLTTTQQPRLRYELALIASETPENRTLRHEPCPRLPGTPVRFTTPSPFAGFEGRLLPQNSDEPQPRLLVQMPMLGTRVSIQVDPDLLEAI